VTKTSACSGLTRCILLDTTERVVVQGDEDVEKDDATNNVPAERWRQGQNQSSLVYLANIA